MKHELFDKRGKEYTLTYNTNGGSGGPPEPGHQDETEFTIAAETPTREGYNFLGWALSKTATEANYKGGDTFTAPSKKTILYAVWEDTHDYLCFTAETSGATVGLSVSETGTPTQGQSFEYSTDKTNWNTLIPVENTLIPMSTTVTLANIGDKVYFRGNNTTVSESCSDYYNFVMTGKIAGSGNIMSLLDKTCQSTEINSNYCFYGLFRGCTSLTTAPDLPATTLATCCYWDMFAGCKSLTTAPALPATALAKHCYCYMFAGCKSLTTAPALPATTLTELCYFCMFDGCTSLTTAPALPSTTLAEECYGCMFVGCTSLTTAPALPATTLAEFCYWGMFDGCTSLTTAPALPATTLAACCYRGMFSGCTSLTTAPALPATTLARDCYCNMFQGTTGDYASLESVTDASDFF